MRAMREEGLQYPQVVEIQDVVNSLASVSADEERAQDKVIVTRQVCEYGGEDVVLGPERVTVGGDEAESHWSEIPVSVRGFWDGPVSDEGARDPGDEELVWMKKGKEVLVVRGLEEWKVEWGVSVGQSRRRGDTAWPRTVVGRIVVSFWVGARGGVVKAAVVG